jgi:integrase
MTTKVVEKENQAHKIPAKNGRKKGDENIPFLTEEHSILDGKAKVIRTRDSGDVYQLRVWMPVKKKYLRQSLKTKDLSTALTEGERIASGKRKKRDVVPAFMTEEHDVLGGKAKVCRTRASGKVYQLRMWIPGESKYYRVTLKTRDLDTALKRGEDEVFKVLGEVHSGKKIFGITLGQLIELYLDWRLKEDVAAGNITKGRWNTIKYQLIHLLDYKGADTKLTDLEKQSCYNYAEYRRLKNPEVKGVTLRNEEATINHMMKFAFREKYNTHFETFEFRKSKITQEEEIRRDTFTPEEYDKLVYVMRSWASKKNSPDEKSLNERLMVKDCILIASNTMLRVGELWQLKWGDILSYANDYDETNKPVVLVTIKVRPETAKTRKTRTITVRGGEYFKRLYERTVKGNRGADDFVFCGKNGKERFSRRKFYDAWEELMNLVGFDYKTRNLTYYSTRHFGITCRLRAGASVFDLAKIAGTGIVYIQNHYGHYDQQMSRAVALKNFSYSKEGISTKDG